MKWTVLYDKRIEKDVEKFRPSTARAFTQAIKDMKEEGPFPNGWNVKPMKGAGTLRMKLDHRHRMIYEAENQILKITILEVTTREGAYK